MAHVPQQLKTPGSAAAVLALALCVVYAGDAGHGFIKDDFRWIRETRLTSVADAPRLLDRTDGFYRPLVSLSFSLNTALAGLAPRAFGLVNLALVSIAAALVVMLARRLGLHTAAALVAAGVWAFNFHGINMAVLWVSGRTASIVTVMALLTALAMVAGRSLLAGLACLLALLSKEEAVLLPCLMAAWVAYSADGSLRERLSIAVKRVSPCFAALVVYFALRMQTAAFWPASAPEYYRFSFSPFFLAQNVLQYADRAGTWAAVTALVLFLASSRRARFNDVERRVAVLGAMWIVGTFGVTIFVPSRSSLYAVLPSVGSALAVGAVASAAMRAAPRRVGATMAVLAMVPLLLAPLYWLRNERWVQLADVSATAIEQVRDIAEREPGRPIVLVDNPLERHTLDSAFGSLWPEAAALFLPPETRSEIVPYAPPESGNAIILRLDAGRLERRKPS
jgi:hypothetical protein